jgi:DNA-binding HxlR family transcriptional regulator
MKQKLHVHIFLCYTSFMERLKQKGDVSAIDCPSREVLNLIADKWAVLIIYSLAKKPLRHNELARALGDISQKVLTQNLRKLEQNGIVTRKVYPVVPPKVEYALSPLGKSLTEVLSTLTKWAETNFAHVLIARERYAKER